MISPTQRILPENTQHLQEINIRAPGGIFLKHILPSQLNTWLIKKTFSCCSFSLYYMCCVLIHHAILCLDFALFPSRGVVGGVILCSFLTSSWVAMSVPCDSRLGGGLLSRVSIDNFPPVVSDWPPGMISILLGAWSLCNPSAIGVVAVAYGKIQSVLLSTISPSVAVAVRVIRSPNRPARSQSHYRLRYPAPSRYDLSNNIWWNVQIMNL